MSFTEQQYENAIMRLLSSLGYTCFYGPDIKRDYKNPLYMDVLVEQLLRINSNLDRQAIDEALHKLTHINHGTLIQKNKLFMDWLQNGIEVSYQKNGKTKYELVRLIDYNNIKNNTFHAINQWTVVENENKRPDVVIFINGLPLVVVELKSCSREETDFSDAYRQIRNYMYEIPVLFQYNTFCIISDLGCSKVGTITSGIDRFSDWKTVDGSYEETQYARYDALFKGMLEPARFLDIIKNFILFSQSTPEYVKILAAYHQYYAIKKAIKSTAKATETDGKAGVFWHTQGSGKSLSMIFYAGLLQKTLKNITIIVITDRNDLDDQLYTQFASCKDFLRQTPEQATSRENLKWLLDGRQANGIFFTTMQKFEEASEALSIRRNIIVMADEAHRSQYGLIEHVKKDGTVVIGAARIIRDNLPNATFIGFTGTPVSSKDRNTREVFGEYI